MKRLPLLFIVLGYWLLAQPDPRAESTKKMAALLSRLFAESDWKSDPNKASERAAYYREGLRGHLDLRTEIRARFDLAENLLVAGDSGAAVEELERLRSFSKERGVVLTPAFDLRLHRLLGLAILRMGEQQNCLSNHNAQSCVYPIRGGGVHRDKRGAEGAVAAYQAVLERDPTDLVARWLLNIAYMTLGQHPEGVPAKWLIPDSILKSDYQIQPFVDVAASAHVDATTHAGGSVADDFDGDGYFDLVVSSSGPADQLRYFRNNRDGTFSDQTIAARLDGETGGLNVIHADYDNDGWPDLLVLRGGWWGRQGKYPPSLLRNNGPGPNGRITFTDVTEQAGLLSLHPTQTAAWADYDNDGNIDLFIGHESSNEERHPSQLFHNNGNGTFTEVGARLGMANLGYVKGSAWGDFNNDGRSDLYVSVKREPNHLFRNDGPDGAGGWKFTDVAREAGVAEPKESFATWFFDYDNDGWQDLFVAGYYIDGLSDIPAFHLGLPNKAETPRLYHNNGNGTFTEVAKSVGLHRVIEAMGSNFGDLDNDGWLDCYFGTGAPEYETLLPNRMFRNDRGKFFQDVTTSGGFGQLQKGHAVSFADFNRDGAEDIYEVLGGAYPGDSYRSVLLKNPGTTGHWLGLRLQGTKSNRSAIGARVRVVVQLKAGEQSFHRTVQPGSSFGDSPLELHVGLGDASEVKRVEIRWPTGKTQQLAKLPFDRTYSLREGDAAPRVLQFKGFGYQSQAHHNH